MTPAAGPGDRRGDCPRNRAGGGFGLPLFVYTAGVRGSAAVGDGQTIWLVGMMGAGKSSVGRALARRLERDFVDTDAEVERRAGASIPEIFERDGEAAFREHERTAIESVASRPVVVALGGGAIAQPRAAERLAATGVVVYLRARPETLSRRVGAGKHRPLVEGLDAEGKLERIRALLAEREPAYQTATVVVDTDRVGVATVANTIVRKLRALGREVA